MALFGKSKEIAELEAKVAYLEQNASPEFRAVEAARYNLSVLQGEISQAEQRKASLHDAIRKLATRANAIEADISAKQEQVVTLDETMLLQEFGLYEPRYDFTSVDEYKAELAEIRSKQKAQVKSLNEQAKSTNWTVNGSKAEGRKMVSDIQKLLLRAFNGDCDEIVRKVKFSNIEASISAIEKSAAAVTKLGRVMNISIPTSYIKLKKDEAYLSFEYAKFKEEEKERIRELKEQEREAKKLEKEIEAERKKLEKERKQYSKALDDIIAQLAKADDSSRADLEAKKAELEANLGDIDKAVADVDYREANQRAGYVYIISNIGSFGEGVFKIGMTRRLDPMERIRELSDASVPFMFDVHALIFSDDAPSLEAALHHEFESKKLNLVNQRREFFRCSLDEIKEAVIKNYDKTVEFVSEPDAEQYRVSEKMREQQAF